MVGHLGLLSCICTHRLIALESFDEYYAFPLNQIVGFHAQMVETDASLIADFFFKSSCFTRAFSLCHSLFLTKNQLRTRKAKVHVEEIARPW